MNNKNLSLLLPLILFIALPVRAEFAINADIIEFKDDTARQQDIEIISNSKESDYIIVETSEIINPGSVNETRKIMDAPAKASLLVTPYKIILGGGGHKVLHLTLLKEPDQYEHIYQVAIKPVIKGGNGGNKPGLKVTTRNEILIIVRPAKIESSYNAARIGNEFQISNNGNTNIVFRSGKQCPSPANCISTSEIRIYPGSSNKVILPLDIPVSYSIWDGEEVVEKTF